MPLLFSTRKSTHHDEGQEVGGARHKGDLAAVLLEHIDGLGSCLFDYNTQQRVSRGVSSGALYVQCSLHARGSISPGYWCVASQPR